MNTLDRFWSKVDKTESCWIWMGAGDRYAQFSLGQRTMVLVHRFAYEMHHGHLIPDGLQVDHLCGVTKCVRPDHLELVTPRENQLRSNGVGGTNARKTHCNHGHEFTEENTYWRDLPSGAQGRQCRQCALDRAWETKPKGQRRRNQYSDTDTCIRGHLFDGVNSRGVRTCSTCTRERSRKSKTKRKVSA